MTARLPTGGSAWIWDPLWMMADSLAHSSATRRHSPEHHLLLIRGGHPAEEAADALVLIGLGEVESNRHRPGETNGIAFLLDAPFELKSTDIVVHGERQELDLMAGRKAQRHVILHGRQVVEV